MARTVEQVFEHHLAALVSGDLNELLVDYADDAIMLTIDVSSDGKEAIRSFFEAQLPAFANFQVTSSEVAVEGDTLLTAWSGESDAVTVRNGVDTFIVRDGLIQRQTFWGIIEPKGA